MNTSNLVGLVFAWVSIAMSIFSAVIGDYGLSIITSVIAIVLFLSVWINSKRPVSSKV